MNPEKVKNAAIVVILTCLIWVTAEQAVTKSELVRVRLQVPATDSDTVIEFLDASNNVLPDNKLDVKFTIEGTSSRMTEAMKLASTVFDIIQPSDLPIPQPGTSEIVSVKVSDLMGGKFEIDNKDHFLLIKDSLPLVVNLRVTSLIEKMVPVAVYNRGQLLAPELIEPKEVKAYVFGDKKNEAVVELTDKQRLDANEKEITAKASVLTPYRKTKEFDVKIKISPIVSIIPERNITSPRFGVLWPLNLDGQYKIVIDETAGLFDEYQQTIVCRGDKEVVDAYYESPVHLMIVISDEDLATIDKPIERIPVYNLPQGGKNIEIVDMLKSPIRFTIQKLVTDYPKTPSL